MNSFDIVAIAASAGGLSALRQVLQGLPASFSAAVVIVQHVDPNARTMLSAILARCTLLQVKQAEAGDRLRVGTVYVARPNWHLLINLDATLALTQTAPRKFARPSADVLFESLAIHQQQAIAVVLTGKGQDGAAGIQKVKQCGGVTIAQDPKTAQWAGMPTAAIQTQAVDLILPLHQIAPTLVKLVQGAREN
jgi:two-component system chemotaxis response regulator CheB